MPSNQFDFQQFTIHQDRCAMKVGIDAVVLGAAIDLPSFCYHALDIGTGTGILALMLSQRMPSVHVDAVEIDADAASQAASNVAASPFADQIDVHKGRIQDFRPKRSYDLIISNPPYFSNSLPSPKQARQQARHTDALSREQLLSAVVRLLNPSGSFWTILPFDQHIHFVQLANSYHLKPATQIRIAPFPNKAPNRVILQFRRIGTRVDVQTLAIREAADSYTAQFRRLTADFYLPKA